VARQRRVLVLPSCNIYAFASRRCCLNYLPGVLPIDVLHAEHSARLLIAGNA